ncbi:MAG: O-antigen ligase family protein [Elusimicrobiota bacterium]|jgi:hypothetical protein
MWVLIALLVAAGPLLRGAWDLWAQTLLLSAAAFGTALWLSARVAGGTVPALPWKVLVWTGVLALLGWAAAAFSPVAALSLPEWRWRLGGLWVFAVLAAVSEEDRESVDTAIHAAAWVLVLLAFWQRFMEGQGRPPGSLLKENVFAGSCLFFLPLAVRRRDYLLLAALLAGMLWSRSVGAWLALALALLLLRSKNGLGRAMVAVLAVICAGAVAAKFRDAAVLDRLSWWSAAWRMFLERPWSGWGPGAFGHLLPAFSQEGGIRSLYAHQSLLESLAETGWLHTLLLFGGAGVLLLKGRTHRTFGAAAVFFQSLWDLTLSIPADSWLFSYCAGSSIRPVSRQVQVPLRWRLPVIILILGAGSLATGSLWNAWQADRLRAMARGLLEGAPSAGDVRRARSLLDASVGREDHPDARVLLAEAGLRAGQPGDGEALASAAGHLERAIELDPYRAGTWRSLETVYRGLGRTDAAAAALSRGRAFCPSLVGAGD